MLFFVVFNILFFISYITLYLIILFVLFMFILILQLFLWFFGVFIIWLCFTTLLFWRTIRRTSVSSNHLILSHNALWARRLLPVYCGRFPRWFRRLTSLSCSQSSVSYRIPVPFTGGSVSFIPLSYFDSGENPPASSSVTASLTEPELHSENRRFFNHSRCDVEKMFFFIT